jgi:hypothetical protein
VRLLLVVAALLPTLLLPHAAAPADGPRVLLLENEHLVMYGWRGVSGSEFAQVCAFPTGARSISGVSVRLEYMDPQRCVN